MPINERPHVTEAINIEDGYLTRTLCLVDGFPAEIEMTVDTYRQRYSRFEISVYPPVSGTWRHVTDMKSEEVGRLPILNDDPETIAKLNEIANMLWQMAEMIVTTGRQRQEELDIDTYVRERVSLDEARASRKTIQISEAYGGISPAARAFAAAVDGTPYAKGGVIQEVDPLASGDHDEAEQAADGVSPGRPAGEGMPV